MTDPKPKSMREELAEHKRRERERIDAAREETDPDDEPLFTPEEERELEEDGRRAEEGGRRMVGVVSWIFIGVSLLLGVIAVVSFRWASSSLAREVVADGVVVGNETRLHPGSKDSSGRQQPGSDMFHAIVEFSDASGAKRTVTMSEAHWPKKYDGGERVAVRYDPAEPLRARISDGGVGDTIGSYAVAIITGFLAFAFGAAALIVRRAFGLTRPERT